MCNVSPLSHVHVKHYDDVTMTTMASQITSLTIVYSTVYSGAYQRKHQSSASLAFVRGIHRGPVNSPHKGPVTRKMFPFDDVTMMFNRAYRPGCYFADYISFVHHLQVKSLQLVWRSDTLTCIYHLQVPDLLQILTTWEFTRNVASVMAAEWNAHLNFFFIFFMYGNWDLFSHFFILFIYVYIKILSLHKYIPTLPLNLFSQHLLAVSSMESMTKF